MISDYKDTKIEMESITSKNTLMMKLAKERMIKQQGEPLSPQDMTEIPESPVPDSIYNDMYDYYEESDDQIPSQDLYEVDSPDIKNIEGGLVKTISSCSEGQVVTGLVAMQRRKTFNANQIRVYSQKQVLSKFD